MNHLFYQNSDSLSFGISRVLGRLAVFGMAARNISVACGVKLAERIDARSLPLQGLKAIVLRFRGGMKRLALLGNVLDVDRLPVKVEQAMAGQPA